MITLICKQDDGQYRLYLILAHANLDRLLEDTPILFRPLERGMQIAGHLSILYDGPGAKEFLAAIPGPVLAILLPRSADRALRGGGILRTRDTYDGKTFNIVIAAEKDLKAVERKIHALGIIGPDTIVRREGFHPDERVSMN